MTRPDPHAQSHAPNWLLTGALIVILFAGIAALPSRAHAATQARRIAVIHIVFGRYGAEAVRVARCESGIRPGAVNGQYRGAFQMGAVERHRYGHGRGLWVQARAAFQYFVLSGRDWSPWECQP